MKMVQRCSSPGLTSAFFRNFARPSPAPSFFFRKAAALIPSSSSSSPEEEDPEDRRKRVVHTPTMQKQIQNADLPSSTCHYITHLPNHHFSCLHLHQLTVQGSGRFKVDTLITMHRGYSLLIDPSHNDSLILESDHLHQIFSTLPSQKP